MTDSGAGKHRCKVGLIGVPCGVWFQSWEREPRLSLGICTGNKALKLFKDTGSQTEWSATYTDSHDGSSLTTQVPLSSFTSGPVSSIKTVSLPNMLPRAAVLSKENILVPGLCSPESWLPGEGHGLEVHQGVFTGATPRKGKEGGCLAGKTEAPRGALLLRRPVWVVLNQPKWGSLYSRQSPAVDKAFLQLRPLSLEGNLSCTSQC